MANEFDFMKEKSRRDWDRYFQIVQESDPYDHLRSVHNGRLIYDHNKPWVTHASIQNGSAVEDFGRAMLYRDVYRKPIVFDEVKYEGNIAAALGRHLGRGDGPPLLAGHDRRHVRRSRRDVPAPAGRHLVGARAASCTAQSPARLAFLRKVMESGPRDGHRADRQVAGRPHRRQAGRVLPRLLRQAAADRVAVRAAARGARGGHAFHVEILDTWNMTVTPVDGTFKIVKDATYRYHAEGLPKIKLPGKPYMALRITARRRATR